MKKILISMVLLCSFLLSVMGESHPQVTMAVDNQYSEWDKLSPIITLPADYEPVVFSKESGTSVDLLPIAESDYWGNKGILINQVKVTISDYHMYFFFDAYERFDENLIIFMYVYKEREKGDKNLYTFELDPVNNYDKGYLFLWGENQSAPHPIGAFVTSGSKLEGSVDLRKIDLADFSLAKSSIDLTACYYDSAAKVYEEFYLTTVNYQDALSN